MNNRRWQLGAQNSLRWQVLLLVVCLYAGPLLAQAVPHGKTIRIRAYKAPLATVLLTIQEQTGTPVTYMERDVAPVTITLSREFSTVEQSLREILSGTKLTYKILQNRIAVVRREKDYENRHISLQTDSLLSISGVVTDPDRTAIPGASVQVKSNKQYTTVTNNRGHFKLNIPKGSVLEISSMGYTPYVRTIQANGDLQVVLTPEWEGVDEVVVVGYGTQRKINLTGAVDKVDSEQLERFKTTNLGEALQNQVPNLNIGIADGKPGRAATFNIRGTASINGQGEPLILLDNVPISSYEFNNISPQDIDNISFLKDASSAAIYGARAAYGVILIQSKQGDKHAPVISYNNNFKWGKATRVPDVYDGVDYLQIQEEEFNGNIGQTYYTEPQVQYPFQVEADPTLPHAVLQNIGGRPTLLLGGPVHNYYKEWFDTYAPKQNHHLSASGGTDRLDYYLSGDLNYEQGSLKFKPEKIDRYNIRANTTYRVNDRVSLFSRSSATLRRDDLPNTYLYGFSSNPWRFIDNTNPLLPEYVDVDGELIPTDIGFYREFIENQSEYKTNNNSFLTQLGTDIKLIDNSLNFHADGSYRYYHLHQFRWWDNTGPYISHSFNNRNTVLDSYSDAGPPKVIKNNTGTETFNINAYLNYRKQFNLHHLDLTGGMTYERYSLRGEDLSREDPLRGIDQHAINLATGALAGSDNHDAYANRSLFLRGNYSYRSKYLVEVNGMHNYTSKFSNDKRGAYFGSFSLGWRMSEEAFFTPLKTVLNDAKIRASFGTLGNQNIGSFDYLSILNIKQSNYLLDGERYVYTKSPQPISDNFTWETSKTIDVGLDMLMLQSRLGLTFDYYQRNTDNMLAPIYSLPSVYGAVVPKENIASLRNRGWELLLSWRDRIGSVKPFDYNIRVNISDYKAVVTDYYNPTNYLGDFYVGQTIGEIWGLNTLGMFQTDEEAKNSPLLQTNSYRQFASAGTLKFEDSNNDGVIDRGNWTLDDHGDYRIIGNSTPRYQFGINLGLAYQGFDMSAFFNGVGKRDVYPGAETANFWSSYNRKYQVLLRHAVEDRWTPENPNAYFPKPQGYIALGNNDLGVPQTRYLQNASYLRLKNLIIGYTLPSKMLGGAFKSVRLYLAGTNLFEWTGLHETLDPEGLQKDPDANQGSVGLGTAYPIQRSYAFGIDLKF